MSLSSCSVITRSIRPSLIGTRWAPTSSSAFSIRSPLSIASTSSATSLPPLDPPQSLKTTKPNRRIQTPPPTRTAPQKPAEPLRDPTPDNSLNALLPLLRSQPPFYITAHIHGKQYLLTAGDRLRLPAVIPDVNLGDVLRLNRATLIGSRDYTLKAGITQKGEKMRYLDERLFVCRAVVIGVESEPMLITEKTRPRRRRVRHMKSKLRHTILRITELSVNGPEALKQNSDVVD